MSDRKYLEWIRRQPSCVSGQFSEYVNGEGRCVAAHVRRAANSGVAYKPRYSCVPLTDAEHRLQHQKGESALGTKEFFDAQAAKYRALWFDEARKKPLDGPHSGVPW